MGCARTPCPRPLSRRRPRMPRLCPSPAATSSPPWVWGIWGSDRVGRRWAAPRAQHISLRRPLWCRRRRRLLPRAGAAEAALSCYGVAASSIRVQRLQGSMRPPLWPWSTSAIPLLRIAVKPSEKRQRRGMGPSTLVVAMASTDTTSRCPRCPARRPRALMASKCSAMTP
jgi:hypothetical protein